MHNRLQLNSDIKSERDWSIESIGDRDRNQWLQQLLENRVRVFLQHFHLKDNISQNLMKSFRPALKCFKTYLNITVFLVIAQLAHQWYIHYPLFVESCLPFHTQLLVPLLFLLSTSLPLSFASINSSSQCFLHLSQLILRSIRQGDLSVSDVADIYICPLSKKEEWSWPRGALAIVVTHSALRKNRANTDSPIDATPQTVWVGERNMQTPSFNTAMVLNSVTSTGILDSFFPI